MLAGVSLLILVAAVILCVLGARRWLKSPSSEGRHLWKYVPPGAALVYETRRPAQVFSALQRKGPWIRFLEMDGVMSIATAFDRIGELMRKPGQGAVELKELPLLISFHTVKKDEFGFLFILNLKRQSARDGWDTAVKNLSGYGDSVKRTYKGITLFDHPLEGGGVFTYLERGNDLVLSTHAHLVEDVIRSLDAGASGGMLSANPELLDRMKIGKDSGNLYFDLQALAEFVKIFGEFRLPDFLGDVGFWDIHVQDEQVLFDGFLFPGRNPQRYYGTSRTASQNLLWMLSDNSALVYHYGLEDTNRWVENVGRSLEDDAHASRMVKSALPSIGIGAADLHQAMADEVIVSYLDKDNLWSPIVYMELASEAQGRQLIRALNTHPSDPPIQLISGVPVTHIENFPVPVLIFGPGFEEFKDTYMVQINDVLLMSNSRQGIEHALDDVFAGNTWARSQRHRQFLSKTNPSAGFSFYLNPAAVWNKLLTRLSDGWLEVAENNDGTLLQPAMIGIQYFLVDGKYYLEGTIDMKKVIDPGPISPDRPGMTYSMGGKAVTKPFLVKDYRSGRFKIMVQEETNVLYRLDEMLVEEWKKPIGSRIVSTIHEIDYFLNNKLQYLFATDRALHLLDEYGGYVGGFPRTLPQSQSLRHLEVIDYDGNRRYRYGLSDAEGRVFLTDKSGNPLPGWRPKTFDSPLVAPPRHYRIEDKDYILINLEGGEFYLFNRKGEPQSPFPLDLGGKILGDYHLEASSLLSETYIHQITQEGRYQKFSLRGNRVMEKVFERTDEEFRIIPDVLGNSFIIQKSSRERVVLLTLGERTLFGRDYPGEEVLYSQYYDFDQNLSFLVNGGMEEGLAYIQGPDGSLITGQPQPSNHPISLLYSSIDSTLSIYLVSGNKVRMVVQEGW